jgi:hypothetical protein
MSMTLQLPQDASFAVHGQQAGMQGQRHGGDNEGDKGEMESGIRCRPLRRR